MLRTPAIQQAFALPCRLRVTSCSYLLPSKSHPVSYARFACDDPVCVFEELRHAPQAVHYILYKLRIAPCFALSQSYRHSRFRRVSHGFTLIPVAFEIASSLLRALRVRRSCLRFRRAYTIKQTCGIRNRTHGMKICAGDAISCFFCG